MVLNFLFPQRRRNDIIKNNDFNRQTSSPTFSFANSGTIATSGFFLVSPEDDNTATKKYLPFNIVRVYNISSSEITIYPNQNKNQGIPIASGTTQIFTQDQIGFVRSLLIENTGFNSITANQIKIQFNKDTLSTDSVFKKIARRLAGESTQEF